MKSFIKLLIILMFSNYANATTCYTDKDCKKIVKADHQTYRNLYLLGYDDDYDGVRDDVEIFIERLYPDSKDNREVSRNTARVYQLIIESTIIKNSNNYKKVSNELAKLSSCYNDHTTLNAKEETAKIKFFIFNSKSRMDAFEIFLENLNGTTQNTLKATFNECRLPQN